MYQKYLENHKRFIEDTVADKYLRNDEKTWEDVKSRMVASLPETSQLSQISGAIKSDRFIPAGSILAALGVPNNQDSMSNCYYVPLTKDSIEAIYEANSNLARIFSKRGGSGISITALRPEGTPVNNAAKTSTGAVSFVPLFAQTAAIIGQSGRRAALLIDISIRHPDAIAFIKMKAFPDEVFPKDAFTGAMPDLSNINVSLVVPDSFMKAVGNNESWNLEFPDIQHDKDFYNENWDGNYDTWERKGGKLKTYATIPAREIMKLWAQCAHTCGDPGGFFIDQAKKAPAAYVDESLVPVGVNP